VHSRIMGLWSFELHAQNMEVRHSPSYA
jgi:hypothetical protein